MSSLVGPGSLIQGDFRSGDHGNFEAVLFRDGELHHLFGVGREHGVEWEVAQTLPSPASGPGSIIQSDFGGGDHKNFEVLLWSGNDLVHYFHDNSDVNLPWLRAQTITTRAADPDALFRAISAAEITKISKWSS
jgi:hypothetical protein